MRPNHVTWNVWNCPLDVTNASVRESSVGCTTRGVSWVLTIRHPAVHSQCGSIRGSLPSLKWAGTIARNFDREAAYECVGIVGTRTERELRRGFTCYVMRIP